MKLAEVIQEVQQEKPNAFDQDRLTGFINEVEADVQEYLGIDVEDRIEYKWGADGNRELIAPPPYDVLYKSYLKAKIDYANEEYQSYANNQAQFTSDFEEWKAWAIRKAKTSETLPDRIVNWW